LILPPGVIRAQFAQPPVEELRRVLEQKEEELGEAQAAVASARARLAKAEGKLELAATEWRKVLAHREARLKIYQELARRRSCPDVRIPDEEGMVWAARAWLAEVENRPDVSLVELPKVVKFYEQRIQYFETLRRKFVIREKEAADALKEDGEELRLAKERLAALRARR
jgi:hypothetical protein